MSRRTRAWQLLIGASLLLGCNGSGCNNGSETTSGKLVGVECGAHTKCPFGYECDYGAKDPNHPKSVGLCQYVECKLTDLCEKPHKECPLPQETAICDKFDNDKYCDCVRPSSQDVPGTPTTGGPPAPTTGATPTSGDKP
jgi:hypothetical protein